MPWALRKRQVSRRSGALRSVVSVTWLVAFGVVLAVGAFRRVDPGGSALASGGRAVLAALGAGKLFGIGAGAGVLVWGLEGGFLRCGRNDKIV